MLHETRGVGTTTTDHLHHFRGVSNDVQSSVRIIGIANAWESHGIKVTKLRVHCREEIVGIRRQIWNARVERQQAANVGQ